MKLARVIHQGRIKLALVEEEGLEVLLLDRLLAHDPNPVRTVIERRLSAKELVDAATGRAAFDEVTFLSPLSQLVRNVFAVGKNYVDHAREFDTSGFNATSGAAAIPSSPQFFTKATTSLAGPTDPIVFSEATTSSVDYEGEIGVVIARECRNVPEGEALDAVFGFVALNDLTARDLQRSHVQWFLGKSLDTFCPLGPWITTIDQAPVESLRVRTWVNGELRQDAPLSDLIFSVPKLIATLSSAMTLLPGDIIATGTPVGVGIGFSPPRFLRDGDVVRVSATGLGELRNTVKVVIR
ncbi:fumarylacetoacetate hydrolase family protein [Roseateles sp.]|uniref:fumarylacetoacetate hydrolase family protein n=1 Tax=Roseateles sp. TaxID=1971397 RepID=UPI002F42363D